MSYVDGGSSLRWPSASTMTCWHHFYSTSDPEPPNLSHIGWYNCVRRLLLLPMDSISMCSNSLYLSKMGEESSLKGLSASTSYWLHMSMVMMTAMSWNGVRKLLWKYWKRRQTMWIWKSNGIVNSWERETVLDKELHSVYEHFKSWVYIIHFTSQ